MVAAGRIYNDELGGVGVGCPDCGALVYSTERHDEWHEALIAARVCRHCDQPEAQHPWRYCENFAARETDRGEGGSTREGEQATVNPPSNALPTPGSWQDEGKNFDIEGFAG